MQIRSLFTFALLLTVVPAQFACTVVTKNDDDVSEPDSGSTEEETSEETDEETTGADAGDEPTADTDDDTAASPDGGPIAESDAGATGGEGDGDAGEVAADAATEIPSETDGAAPEGDAGSDDEVTEDEGDSGSTDPGPEPAGDTYKSGSVALSQMVITVPGLDTPIVSGGANAGFSVVEGINDAPAQPTPVCDIQQAGDCALTVCDVSDTPPEEDETPVTVTSVSAGDVTISGLAQDITLSSEANGTYQAATFTESLWSGGESVVASSAGSDDVPAFELELTAPSAVTLTTPVIDLVAPVEISRAADLEVAWSEGTDGSVTVALGDSDSEDQTRSLVCTVPASAGGVTISQDLLSGFSDSGAITVSISATGTVVVEDWNLAISASSSLAAGQATFTD